MTLVRLGLVVACMQALAIAAVPAAALDVRATADGLHVQSSSGWSATLRALPALARDAAGRAEVLAAAEEEPRAVADRLGSAVAVETHPGIRLAARGATLEVQVEASLLAALPASSSLDLAWERHLAGSPLATRVTMSVPVARWHDAGSPDPFVLDASILLGRWPEGPRRPAALADCPDDAILECDGAGNLAERQAWLDAFTGTADAGCGTVTRILETTPGILEPILTFDDFSDLSGWTLNGRTATMGNPAVDDAGRLVLRLTSSFSESGSAFVSRPVALLSDSSFRARFTFRISLPGGASDTDGVGADGMAFVVQSVANTAGGLGGGIGYQGIGQSMGVEFDTWNNGAWDDFDGNHVGVNVDGNIDSIAQAGVARRMNDGDVWTAWVDYDGRSDRVEVRLDPGGIRPPLPIVSASVDLPALLRGTDAFVGFTSGTGAAHGTHDILSFVFEAYAPVGCPMISVESVTSTVIDDCGATSCSRLLWIADTSGPQLAPAAPVTSCGGALEVDAGPDGTGWAEPRVHPFDACRGFALSNDRTPSGADASDFYPCGRTPVRFDAIDECGNATSCEIVVHVRPGGPPDAVGGALRVRKDASGAPVLEWPSAPHPPEIPFLVLAGNGRLPPRPSAWPGAVRYWTDAMPGPGPIRWYDVRALACDGSASRD